MPREFPDLPMLAVGAVIVDQHRVLLVRRGHEPLKGQWSLPGGLLELGEPLITGLVREVREETGLIVEPIQLIELLDRIHRDGDRIRYHYVIADYLCRVAGGTLQAASDADEVRWAKRNEWLASINADLNLDQVTIRVIEAAWHASQSLQSKPQEP